MATGRQQFWEDVEDRQRFGVPDVAEHEVEDRATAQAQDVARATQILTFTGNSLFASAPAYAYDLASGFISDIPPTALLRRSKLFATHARADARNWETSFAGYQRENKRARRNRKHILLRMTAVDHPKHPSGVHDVRNLKSEGQTVYACLADGLDNMSRSSKALAGIVHPLYVGIHDVPQPDSRWWVIGRHYHIGVDIDRRGIHTDEDWQDVREKIEDYLGGYGFEVYVPEDLDAYDDDDDSKAAKYAAGKVADCEGPSADAMWIYHCQTKDASFFVPRGDFKKWRAALKDAGFRAKYGRGGVEIVEKKEYAAREHRPYPHAKALVNHRSDGFEMRTNLIIGNPDTVDLNPDTLSGCDLDDDVKRARHLADESVGKAVRGMSSDGKAALADWLGHLRDNIVKSVNPDVIHPSHVLTSLVTGNPTRTAHVVNTALGYLPGVSRALSSHVGTPSACRIVLNAVITSARERHRSISKIRSLAGMTASAGDQGGGITDEMVGKWRAEAGRMLDAIINPETKKPAKPACMTLTRRPTKASREDAEAAAWRQAVEDQRAEHAATLAARAEQECQQVPTPTPTPEPEEYRPTSADYLKLEALYREFYPKAPDGALRTCILSLDAFHAGPITPKILEGIRAQLKPRRAA